MKRWTNPGVESTHVSISVERNQIDPERQSLEGTYGTLPKEESGDERAGTMPLTPVDDLRLLHSLSSGSCLFLIDPRWLIPVIALNKAIAGV